MSLDDFWAEETSEESSGRDDGDHDASTTTASSSSSGVPLDASDDDDDDVEEHDSRDHGAAASASAAATGSGRHAYLGEVDDVTGAGGGLNLAPGTLLTLSIYPLQRTVVFPGESVPIILPTERADILIESVMRAPKPFTRLFGMSLFDHGFGTKHRVGCTVELVQFKRGDSGDTSLVVKAHQRFVLREEWASSSDDGAGLATTLELGRVVFDQAGLLHCKVEVLPETSVECRTPRACKQGCSYWDAWAHRPFDIYVLADKAAELYEKLGTDHQHPEEEQEDERGEGGGERASNSPCLLHRRRDPVQFSFWIASALPLDSGKQQELLEMDGTNDRLLAEIAAMKKMLDNVLCCAVCDANISLSSEIFRMTDSLGGVFVNTHGFLHDIVTLLRIKGAALQGEPETAHCWFPGYAWTIANCKRCGSHLGWKFTEAVQGSGLRPSSFWGVRNGALSVA